MQASSKEREHGPVVKGRIVRFFCDGGPEDGYAAIVCRVHPGAKHFVNLHVFPENVPGPIFEVGVEKFDGEEPKQGRYWDWAQRQ